MSEDQMDDCTCGVVGCTEHETLEEKLVRELAFDLGSLEGDPSGTTLEEIALKHGVSPERIAKIQAKVVEQNE